MLESRSFTCSNPSCGKMFSNPLKASNLSSGNVVTYDACPYCLTEITIEENDAIVIPASHLSERETERATTPSFGKESSESPPKVTGCSHHFGYLSKRPKKDNIPEECIVCDNIVRCMLKVVNE